MIKDDVRPPEAINRLLWIADDKQFAGRRTDLIPIGLSRIAGRKQDEDLRLHRIRILELIHENVRESVLEQLPDGSILFDQISCAGQKIDEIELAGT